MTAEVAPQMPAEQEPLRPLIQLDAPGPRWVKVLDQDRCIGCHACTTACKSENEVPLGVTRTYVKAVEVGTFPQVRRDFQVTRCNQCSDAPCVAACPTSAMFTRPDGIVDFNKDSCIGCKACIAACPYDAIFINPEDHSAEKCNFCAQRIDVGLEPACVVVCPAEAILVGDLNDPTSKVAQIINREPVQVRRPEKETRPGVFYKGAHQATLDPLAARSPEGPVYMWSEKESGPMIVESGHPNYANSSAAALLAYDVTHRAPWDWRVSLYTWTKGIAAGVYIVPLLLLITGVTGDEGPLWQWAAPILAGGFLGLTGLILLADLEHPLRFVYIFTRPQWRSWLVRGAVIISAYGLVLGLHFAIAAFTAIGGANQLVGVQSILAIAGLPLALMTAVYTAYLFAQAKARDLWQNPLLPPHLATQAVLAGSAMLIPVAMILEPPAVAALALLLAVTSGLHLLLVAGEITLPHSTAHAHLASWHMTHGRFARWFWLGVVFVAAGLLAPFLPAVAAMAALVGLLAHEHAYVQAGQSVPTRMTEEERPVGRVTEALGRRVSAAREATEARGETFYPGPSRIHLAAYPPKERWDDWIELDSKAWPKRVEKRYMLVPTTCFNCESACGLLAYVDRETLQVRKFEGNPEHPGSRGRNCAKGPATINQVTDPDRILQPLRRAGKRGEGRWETVTWDEALDDLAARIRKAIVEERPNEVMYHVGRPGEDGFTERVLASWGVDGHNSHTNVCSSGGRTGYHFWTGIDRPSPDHANAKVILLISSHLEAGHYFNPHAQRIVEAKANGAKVIVLDTRLSNTATHADHWLSPWPGSEAAIMLAIANHVIKTDRYDREFVRRWWNWEEYVATEHPGQPRTFETFEAILHDLYSTFTFEYAAQESGIDAAVIAEVAAVVAEAGTRLSTHTWRSAAAGNLGGWQVSRTLFMLNCLLGAVAVPGGTYPNAWNKFVPKPIHVPPHPHTWNDLTWPVEYPLALNELSFLLPHFLKEDRGKLDVYFSRVYNPVWTNPDGFSWIEVLTDESRVGMHVALTPTWNETAFFADYILPMGHGSERHDVHSYEQYDGQWIGFRQPVLRAARERLGESIDDTRQVNPGEVWEENEFWMELSWRIDRDGALGIRKFYESPARPGERMSVDDYYGYMFDHSVPGLPEAAAKEGLSPLGYMRRYGAFEIRKGVGPVHQTPVPVDQLVDTAIDEFGRVYAGSEKPGSPNVVPMASPDPDSAGRRPVGVVVDGEILQGFPTPSGRLEFYSSTLDHWGWPEYAIPGYIRSHVHREALAADEMVLISTFRLPVQIHTRSANAKWLDEIAHTNPLWLHPQDATRLSIGPNDLVRVETEIGYFVVKPWLTEGIRPGVAACSHHMGRWKLGDTGQRAVMATVALDHQGDRWAMSRTSGVEPFESSDPDTKRIWWTDVGVHQNLTFPVHPDPISGQHCWHQAVRVRKAEPNDRYGDIHVDTQLAHETYTRWLALTRPAAEVSPDGNRRPYWLMRPLKPARETYRLPEQQPKVGAT